MPLRLLILNLLLLAQTVPGQTADDFFHGGAQFYISNNVAKARELVDQGLNAYPEDIKLKKLDELLKQQSQQSSQKNQQNQSQQQSQTQEQPQNSQQQDQQSAQSQQPDNQKNSEQDRNQPQPQQAREQEEQASEDQQQARAAGHLTPEEAQRLLDAQKNDELMLPASRNEQAATPEGPIKDW